ncbi:MAG: SGNH/GDSL hydrolase family protein [Nocardioidaceae bacterium]
MGRISTTRTAATATAAVAALGVVVLVLLVAGPHRPPTEREARAVGPAQAPPDLRVLSGLLDGRTPATWVFTGDSITQGSTHTHGRRSFTEHFTERVRGELGRASDVVINTGVSGDRTGDVLAGFAGRVLRFDPDAVVVMLGTNDSVAGKEGRDRFRESLGTIVERIRDSGATPVLQTPNPVDTGGSPRHWDLAGYVDIVRDLARRREVVLVDHYAHWLSVGDGRPPGSWLSDPVHPNGRGHLEMARMLFEHLRILDPTTPTGRARWGARGMGTGTT